MTVVLSASKVILGHVLPKGVYWTPQMGMFLFMKLFQFSKCCEFRNFNAKQSCFNWLQSKYAMQMHNDECFRATFHALKSCKVVHPQVNITDSLWWCFDEHLKRLHYHNEFRLTERLETWSVHKAFKHRLVIYVNRFKSNGGCCCGGKKR